MKKAKKNPFYSNLKKKISLNIENKSTFIIPDYKFLFKIIINIPFFQKFNKVFINILFCDEDKAIYYNSKFRNKNYATNILSFCLNDSISSKNELIGDLVICPKIIEKESKEQGKSIKEHYAHIIIHGILHLIGFDHKNDNDAIIMESIEIKLMQYLGYNNPYMIED